MAVPGIRPRGPSYVGHVTGSLKMGIGAFSPGHLDESRYGIGQTTRRDYPINIHAGPKWTASGF